MAKRARLAPAAARGAFIPLQWRGRVALSSAQIPRRILPNAAGIVSAELSGGGRPCHLLIYIKIALLRDTCACRVPCCDMTRHARLL